jgi:hypothetical protein
MTTASIDLDGINRSEVTQKHETAEHEARGGLGFHGFWFNASAGLTWGCRQRLAFK